MRCSSPESVLVYGARCTRAPYGVAPELLINSMNRAEDQLSLLGSSTFRLKSRTFFEKVAIYDTYPQPSGLEFESVIWS